MRPFEPSDEEALHALWNDRDVGRYLWDGKPISRDMVRERIARSQHWFVTRGYGMFLATLNDAPACIGFAGLGHIADPARPELYYALYPAYWGRGLATEAARAVLQFGFETAGLPEIYAGADVTNAASFRVMERLGMTVAFVTTINGLPTRYYRIAPTATAGPHVTGP